MSVARGIVGGLIGGLLGAAVWTGVTYASGYELGLLAWVIGLLTGIGFCVGLRGRGSTGTGLAAAAVAVVALLIGKAGVVSITVNQMMAEAMEEGIDDETALDYLTSEIYEQWIAEGRSLEWPDGMSESEALEEGAWPVGVESAAQRRWMAMSDAEHEQYAAGLLAQREEEAAAAMSVFIVFALIRSFGLFDLLWCGLAITTAFKVGATAKDPDEAGEPALDDAPAAPVLRPAPAPTPGRAKVAAKQEPDSEVSLGSPLRGIRTDGAAGDRNATGVPAAWADKPLMAQDPNDVGREAA